MKPIKIYYNKMSNTLNIWLDDPAKEEVAEETVEEPSLSKTKRVGRSDLRSWIILAKMKLLI